MNASTSAGRPSARSRSGSVTSCTSSVSLQAMNASARTPAATKRSLDIDCSSTEKWARSPSSRRTTGPAARGVRCLERRAQSDREGAQVRERKGIHRIDGRRTCAVQLRPARQTDLGIEAAVAREREQVAAHDADLPIARVADRADVIREEQLPELRVARVLDRVAVGSELIVETAEPREAVGRRRPPVVADRLGGLDRLPDLIDVIRQEVEVRPVEALVPDLLADRGIEERVKVEPLVPHVLRDGEAEIRQRVPERDVLRLTLVVPQQDRHAPVHGDAPRTTPKLRIPQVVADAHTGVVAAADPHQEAFIVPLEGAGGTAAIAGERRRQLGAVREE